MIASPCRDSPILREIRLRKEILKKSLCRAEEGVDFRGSSPSLMSIFYSYECVILGCS